MKKITVCEFESNSELTIGEIPIWDYITYMDSRFFSKERSIQYTKEIYDTDISSIINTKNLLLDFDVFNNFEEIDKLKSNDSGTRKWFNNQGKARYERFLIHLQNIYGLPRIPFADFFTQHYPYYLEIDDIHHINLLAFSRNNHITNLIGVNEINHTLIHANPDQGNYIYDNRAVDYLYWLYNGNRDNIFEAYNLLQFKSDSKLMVKIFLSAIEEGIIDYYERNLSKVS
jgi:hypothetical protein